MKDLSEEEIEEGFWTCNINGRGRLVRLIMSLAAFGAAAWCWWSFKNAFWSSGLLAFGLVALFEAFRGWCVLRAFGLRTPF